MPSEVDGTRYGRPRITGATSASARFATRELLLEACEPPVQAEKDIRRRALSKKEGGRLGSAASRSGLRAGSRSGCPGNQALLIPGAVSQLATFDGGQAGRKGSEQKGGGHPQREAGGGLAGIFHRLLGLGDDVVHT